MLDFILGILAGLFFAGVFPVTFARFKDWARELFKKCDHKDSDKQ